MAVELHIFLHNERVPDHSAWQCAIEQLGFPAVLSQFDARRELGFRPVTYKGKPTGFEFSLGPSADVVVGYPHVAATIAGRDLCATFRWGRILECGAALSAAAALAKIANGIYFYPDDDILLDAEAAVAAASRDLASI